MENKCINYKLLLLIMLPIISLTASVFLLCLLPNNFFLILISAISLICVCLLLCFEPIFYCINEKEIRIVCILKKHCFSFKEIRKIALKYDAFFEVLFIKDYVLILNKQIEVPKRCARILKCAKTKKLIEKYYTEKLTS